MTKKNKKEKRPFISKIIILILFISLFSIYARYVGIKGLKVKEYNISSKDLPNSFDGFTIVHFSDLKYGSTIFIDDVKNIVNKINDLKPDIVVFTGDLISENYKLSSKEAKDLTTELSKIDPLLDKYSIKGDKDSKDYDKIIKSSNFIDLTNNHELIYFKGLEPIALYGLGSLNKDKLDIDSTFVEDAKYKILLAHEPDIMDEVKSYKVNLLLAGHSLNSSINLPYIKNIYNIKGATKYNENKYTVGKTKLYISNGLGTSRLKSRLFNKPSISVYRLYKE